MILYTRSVHRLAMVTVFLRQLASQLQTEQFAAKRRTRCMAHCGHQPWTEHLRQAVTDTALCRLSAKDGMMSKRIPLGHGKEAIVDDTDYDWLTQWTWRASSKRHGHRYATRTDENNCTVSMHRVIMQPSDDMQVDHINQNGLDNRRKNLRIATHSQNLANRKRHKNNTSGYMGVWKDNRRRRKPWRAEVRFHNKKYTCGAHATPEEAAHAYDAMARKLHGEFATLNFPKG